VNQSPNDLKKISHDASKSRHLYSDNTVIIAVCIHLSGWLLFFFSSLIAFCIVKDEFVKSHAKEALNFQLNILMYVLFFVAVTILMFPAIFIDPTGIVFYILASVSIVITVFSIAIFTIYPIIGAVKASGGKKYRFPFVVRFIS
jgi:uncharacterized Tic20 family protein